MEGFLRNFFSLTTFLFIFTLSSESFGYNSERCYEFMERLRYGIGTGEIVSSTQFTSSFGECSLVGDRSKEIEHYFIVNYESLKIDASRGHGEYLNGLTTLYSCSDEDAGRVYKYVKSNYSTLFDTPNPEKNDGKIMYEKFRQELINNNRDFLYCII